MPDPLRASPVLLEMARHFQTQPARKGDELFTAVVELTSSTLVDSARTPDTEAMRTMVCADWLVRGLAPKALLRSKRPMDADRLRAQKPIVSQRAAEQAAGTVQSIAMGVDGAAGALLQAVESAARAAARRETTSGEAGRAVAAAWLGAEATDKKDAAWRKVLVTDLIALVTHLLQMR